MTLDSRTTTRSDLEGKRLPELHEMAQSMGVSGYQRLRKGDLIEAIITKSGGDGHVDGGAASNGEMTKGRGGFRRAGHRGERWRPGGRWLR